MELNRNLDNRLADLEHDIEVLQLELDTLHEEITDLSEWREEATELITAHANNEPVDKDDVIDLLVARGEDPAELEGKDVDELIKLLSEEEQEAAEEFQTKSKRAEFVSEQIDSKSRQHQAVQEIKDKVDSGEMSVEEGKKAFEEMDFDQLNDGAPVNSEEVEAQSRNKLAENGSEQNGAAALFNSPMFGS